MKFILALLLLSSCTQACFSQAPGVDSLKELNDLKALKSQLVEKSEKLGAQINQKQILIDSCKKKLQEVKSESDKLKLSATGKEKRLSNRSKKR